MAQGSSRRTTKDDARRISHLRLVAQRLVASRLSTPGEAAQALLAVQAQDFASAKWSLGLRAPGTTEKDVHAALASGAIVRSWPLRGTLHFCAAEDLPWLLTVGAPRVIAGLAKRRAALELDAKTLERARRHATAVLAGSRALSRTDLLESFARAGISPAGQRGYHILAHLGLTGTLCFGPPSESEQTFVLLETWVKKRRELARDEALGELARRYFESHGPATVRDFTGWTKLAAGDVRIAVALAKPALAEREWNGTTYLMAPSAEDALANAGDAVTGVLALPGFDEYILGYQDKSAALAPEYAERICPGGNGIFQPTIVHDGRVVGTWRRETKASRRSGQPEKRTIVQRVPFTRLGTEATRAFTRAVSDYGKFLGNRVEIVTR